MKPGKYENLRRNRNKNHNKQIQIEKSYKEKQLPPNTSGKSRGYLEFKIHEVNWRKIANVYGGVQARVIWWGEHFLTGTIIR